MITIATGHSVRPKIALAAVALCCAGLAACSSSGSSDTTSAPASSSQPTVASPASAPAAASAAGTPGAASGESSCGLVTGAEVTAAMGKPMNAGTGGGGICVYSGTADPALFVYVQTYPDTQSMATPKENEASGEHLPGLGDDAFWTEAGNVFVQKGTRGFLISIPSLALSSKNAPPSIVTLATQALGRF
jgi:hypothetical protein